jgi:HEAT repeat protein
VGKWWAAPIVLLLVGGAAAWLLRSPAGSAPGPEQGRKEPVEPTPEEIRALGSKAAEGDRFSAAAALELSKVRDPAGRLALREIALSPDPLASANALHALGNFGDPADLPLFREILKTRAGERPWTEAVRALGKNHSAEARVDLELLLDSASAEQDRLAILATLREAAHPESISPLERFLSRPGLSESERAYAELAIRRCRESSAPLHH